MKKLPILILLWVMSLNTLAQPGDNPLEVGFDHHLGAQVPLDLLLRNERGNEVTVKELLDDKPVLLVLGYYECPMLCHKVQDGLVEGLTESRMRVGKEFRILTVSVDPEETSQLAAAKRESYLKAYPYPVTHQDWPFLVGTPEALDTLQTVVGFRSAKLKDQISHPAGMIVLTPSGKVSSYLQGLRFPALSLEQAIEKASREEEGSFLQPVLLLCYQYDPATGKYSLAIYRLVQLLGCATVLLMMAAIFFWLRRERRQRA